VSEREWRYPLSDIKELCEAALECEGSEEELSTRLATVAICERLEAILEALDERKKSCAPSGEGHDVKRGLGLDSTGQFWVV